MALLNAFCRAWVVAFAALMTSTSELIFIQYYWPFRTKCQEFAAKFARYFCNILGNAIKFITLKIQLVDNRFGNRACAFSCKGYLD
ncbi:hypothetical protein BEH76_11250 [Shewanella algae]|nr:hypothetical protein BEH76_11250 [Shewanella algae]